MPLRAWGLDPSWPRSCTHFAAVIALGFLALPLALSPAAAAGRGPSADVHFELGARALRQGDAKTAVTELADAARLAPDDTAVLGLYARALLAADEPREALSTLARLRDLDPGAPDLAFMEGLANLRLERWPEAVAQLESARAEAPDSARLRLLLGLAYDESGASQQAEAEFARAVSLDPALQSEVTYRRGIAAARREDRDSARRLFDQLQAQFPGSELARSAAAHAELLDAFGEDDGNAFASVGLEYDSNVNFAGEGDNPRISREGDFAAVLQAGFDLVVFDVEPFLLRVGYSGFLSAHRDIHDFDIEASSFFAEATYVLSPKLSLELDYELDWVWADWSSFSRTQAIEPAVNLELSRGWLTRPFARFEDRSFFTDPATPELDADGRVRLLGIDQYWFPTTLTPFGGGFVRAGGRYRDENAQGSEFDSRGWEWLVTLGARMPLDSSLMIEGSFERRRFDEPSSFQPTAGDREDRIARVWVALRRPLSGPFSIELSWRYTHWASNVDAYDFNQSVTGLRLWYDY